MTDWRDVPLMMPPIGLVGWVLIGLRLPLLAVAVFGGLALLLLVRLVEAPLCGMGRPVTPFITQAVCRAALRIMGIDLHRQGRPMRERGAVVANHASWLDIFALNACDRVYFVSKSEVARWPGIGWLARSTGTLFIARDAREAKVQQELFEARLRAGHRLLFFPEGTSTDTQRILPFKSTLFAAFFTHNMNHVMHIQSATVNYVAPEGSDRRFYGWWGDMDFAPHLFQLLAQPRHGRVEVRFHDAVAVDDFAGRKALAAHCETTIRRAHIAADHAQDAPS